MSSSLRRGTLAATVLVLSAATLTACAAGNNAETLQIKPDNAAATVGDIKLQAVNVITTKDGPAAITGKIFNTGGKAETLNSITLGQSGPTVKLTPAKGGTLTVPADGWLALGGKGNASAVIEDGTAVENGSAPRISFDLSRTGAVRLRATVVPDTHSGYREFGPTVQPSETASPTDPAESADPTDPAEAEGDADATPGADATTEPGPDATPEGAATEPAPGGSEPADAGH